MPLPVKEYIPRECCTDVLLKRLRAAKLDTDGYVYSLEKILLERRFNLPCATEDDYKRPYFGYLFQNKVRLYLNYADTLANCILELHDAGILNMNMNGKTKH